MSYAVQGALLAVPAIGFASLAIDISWMQVVNDQLQTSADSAALAGAGHINRPDEVAPTAEMFAEMHSAGNSPVELDQAKVEIGLWDGAAFTPQPDGRFVRVEADATSATVLARVFGMYVFQSNAVAIATMRDQTLCGLIGFSTLDLSGSVRVDSYDSSKGPYLATAAAEAGVCSNQATVNVGGNTNVLGNVLAGVGGEVSVTGSAAVSGVTGTVSEPLVPPIVGVPGTSMVLPNLVQTPIVLAPGNYYLLGDFSVTATGEIVVTGETHIYVDGDVTVNGNGFINTGADPHDLSIEVIGAHTVHYNGNSIFYGALVAPLSSVTLNGTADLYGTIVGDDVNLIGNLAIHLDASLVEIDPTGGHASLVF